MRKKIISLVLAAMMIIGICPINIFAEGSSRLENLVFRAKNSVLDSDNIALTPSFNGSTKSYELNVLDSLGNNLFIFPQMYSEYSKTDISVTYTNLSKNSEAVVPVSNGTAGKLTNGIKKGAVGNTILVSVPGVNESDTDIYTITVNRIPTLASLSVTDGKGNSVPLTSVFSSAETSYELVTVEDQIVINAEGSYEGYEIKVNGNDSTTVSLNEGSNEVKIRVTIPSGLSNEYTINAVKKVPAKVSITTDPAGAIVYLRDADERRITIDSDGYFYLIPGNKYHYTVSKTGYISNVDEFTAESKDINVKLEKAPEVELEKFDATWPSFGYNKENNIIIDNATPTTKDGASLYWAEKIGEGYDSGAAGVPILVGNYLYNYAGKSILKVDKMTGEVVASGTMHHASSFAINSPTYAEGMIFVGLSNGCIQAFNADTLESLWIYNDPLKGQPNSTITYSDGYIYTGFWNGEAKDAAFVCLSITDEDTSDPKNVKEASWRYVRQGGFYWAGAYINDNYVIVGTDDGQSGYTNYTASLLSFDKETGYLVSSIDGFKGDIRSSVSYDKDSDRLYFTSKGGYLYSAKVGKDGKLSDKKEVDLGGMSTSTPTVHNGRAYVGVSGSGQFVQYSGHCIAIVDVDNWKVAYTVDTQGYPQTTATLTTYYEEIDGYDYVYFFDNYTPGKLRVVKDKKGVTEPLMTDVEIEISGEKEIEHITAHAVFTPTGALAQYCICTPIIDSDGTLYFKNDSAYFMALGAAIDHIDVTKNPDNMSYSEGDIFDPTGMEVTAYYVNGTERDITKYVEYKTTELTEEDSKFEITFPHVTGDEIPSTFIELDFNNGGIVLKPVEESSSKNKITLLSDTVKLTEIGDNEYAVNKANGGTIYAAVVSDEELEDVALEITGDITGEIIEFDPAKYKMTGLSVIYSVYDCKNPKKDLSQDGGTYRFKIYDLAKKRADELNENENYERYRVKCDSYVYIAKITVPQNYSTKYKMGTYKITAKDQKGTKLTSSTITLVNDICMFEYETVKDSVAYEIPLVIGSEEFNCYSDYLTKKYGYSKTDHYDPDDMLVIDGETPTAVCTTAFRSVVGKKMVVEIADNVTLTIPEVSKDQKSVNFINAVSKTAASNSGKTKKSANMSITFYGKQQIMSDFTIDWDLEMSAWDLVNAFGIRLEEEDVITYYITKDGDYFQEFTIDYGKDDVSKNVELTLNCTEGMSLGTFKLTTVKPAVNETEENPNTGAF